ncbi:uncharacterized protein LOC107303742 [Oryza brachyantha]|uniref:uncharacterized protein LOC107303742 n=1 Tax=Oryza brachyantha TaxID=4533 RepID=UPI001ADAEDA3|nr:uncharacterized protein LOC107303742 [Oryza brachyantha]
MPPPPWASADAKAAVFPVPPPPPPVRSRGGRRSLRPCSAQKPGGSEGRRGAGALLVSSRGALLRSGAALFALGFVDAGYSGDWSRIGAISKDTEELLKLGAYAVVPLCVAFVFLPSSQDSSDVES